MRGGEQLLKWGGVAMAALVVVGVVAWLAWPDPQVEPRAREYRDVTACLLTDGDGVAGAKAVPVWAGMQDASAKTNGQVRYLAVTGEQTVENARTFVGTLISGRCGLVVAEPGIADEAIRSMAGGYPKQSFLVVGGDSPRSANLSRVAAGEVSAAVQKQLAGTD